MFIHAVSGIAITAESATQVERRYNCARWSTNWHRCMDSGEVAEWSNAPDSKSGIPVSGIVGSNPTLSAIKKAPRGAFLLVMLQKRVLLKTIQQFFCVAGRFANDETA